MKISRRIIVGLALTSLLLGILAPQASAAKPAGKPGGNTSPSADLSITITDSPDPVLVGGEVTYVMTISNAGPSSPFVSLRMHVEGDSHGTARSTQGSCYSESQISLSVEDVTTCDFGTLTRGQTVRVTATRRALSQGTLRVSTDLWSSLPDPNISNNKATESTTVTTPTPVPGVAKPLNACGGVVLIEYHLGQPQLPGYCEFQSTGMSLTVSGSHIRPRDYLDNEIQVVITGLGRVLATCRGLGACAAVSSEAVPVGTRLTCTAWEGGSSWLILTPAPGLVTYACTG